MSRLTVNLSVTSAGSAELAIGYGTDASEADRDDLFARSRTLMDSVCRRVDAPPTVADVRESIAYAQLQGIADHVAKVIDLDEHDLVESVGILCTGFTPGHDDRVRRDRRRLDSIGETLERYDEGGDGDAAEGDRALKGEADARWAIADRDLATALIDAIEQIVQTNGPAGTTRFVGKMIADYRAPKVTTRDADVPF